MNRKQTKTVVVAWETCMCSGSNKMHCAERPQYPAPPWTELLSTHPGVPTPASKVSPRSDVPSFSVCVQWTQFFWTPATIWIWGTWHWWWWMVIRMRVKSANHAPPREHQHEAKQPPIVSWCIMSQNQATFWKLLRTSQTEHRSEVTKQMTFNGRLRQIKHLTRTIFIKSKEQVFSQTDSFALHGTVFAIGIEEEKLYCMSCTFPLAPCHALLYRSDFARNQRCDHCGPQSVNQNSEEGCQPFSQEIPFDPIFLPGVWRNTNSPFCEEQDKGTVWQEHLRHRSEKRGGESRHPRECNKMRSDHETTDTIVHSADVFRNQSKQTQTGFYDEIFVRKVTGYFVQISSPAKQTRLRDARQLQATWLWACDQHGNKGTPAPCLVRLHSKTFPGQKREFSCLFMGIRKPVPTPERTQLQPPLPNSQICLLIFQNALNESKLSSQNFCARCVAMSVCSHVLCTKTYSTQFRAKITGNKEVLQLSHMKSECNFAHFQGKCFWQAFGMYQEKRRPNMCFADLESKVTATFLATISHQGREWKPQQNLLTCFAVCSFPFLLTVTIVGCWVHWAVAMSVVLAWIRMAWVLCESQILQFSTC